MATGWIVRRNGKETSPISIEKLKEYAKAGRLRSSDHVRREDQRQWREAGTIEGLFPAIPLLELSLEIENGTVATSANSQPSSAARPASTSSTKWYEKNLCSQLTVVAILFGCAAAMGIFFYVTDNRSVTQSKSSGQPPVSHGTTWKQYLRDCGKDAQRAHEVRAVSIFTDKYQNQIVSWKGSIDSVLRGQVTVKMDPSESLGSDVSVDVPEKMDVTGLNKGDVFSFAGKITSQGGTFTNHRVEYLGPDESSARAELVRIETEKAEKEAARTLATRPAQKWKRDEESWNPRQGTRRVVSGSPESGRLTVEWFFSSSVRKELQAMAAKPDATTHVKRLAKARGKIIEYQWGVDPECPHLGEYWQVTSERDLQ